MGCAVRVLDLFCGAGGAAMGYHQAGAQVVGVDIDHQPRYPFTFHRADALDVLHGRTSLDPAAFDLIHASPPCQAYSTGVTSRSSRWVPTKGKDEPALIGTVHRLLLAVGVPWVIENVAGARDHMPQGAFTLCGAMFGRPIPRHRLFATSPTVTPPAHPACRGLATRSAAALGWDYRDMTVTGKGRRAGTSTRWAHLLGVDWPMTQHDLAEAIPPAYTQWIGTRMLGVVA